MDQNYCVCQFVQVIVVIKIIQEEIGIWMFEILFFDLCQDYDWNFGVCCYFLQVIGCGNNFVYFGFCVFIFWVYVFDCVDYYQVVFVVYLVFEVFNLGVDCGYLYVFGIVDFIRELIVCFGCGNNVFDFCWRYVI